jgi:hypothetical protein
MNYPALISRPTQRMTSALAQTCTTTSGLRNDNFLAGKLCIRM